MNRDPDRDDYDDYSTTEAGAAQSAAWHALDDYDDRDPD